jgi:hypothetical protein
VAIATCNWKLKLFRRHALPLEMRIDGWKFSLTDPSEASFIVGALACRAHLTFLQLTGLPSQSEVVKVAVGFIPRMDITNDSVA